MNFKFTIQDLVAKNRTSIQNINIIKQWLPTTIESYIPPSIHDELIALFLMSRNNDIDLTKDCIRSHYGLRYEAPEMFDDRNLERIDVQMALNTLRLVSIPRRTEDNYLVLYASVRDTDFFSFELHPIMKASLMLFDIEHHTNPPDGIHMHPVGWNVEEVFPKSCLPKEVGGELESEDELNRNTLMLYKEREAYWKEEERLRKTISK
ncbi:unnamed protein product [Diabrotica balteata]|uniref:Uncharacterized protein n=1 Tax=Diabrotica balteata TaxID=107213 RepID=A0A9N9TAW1_DIABA|nr:unnamed protein product [Diabrotica balteata]